MDSSSRSSLAAGAGRNLGQNQNSRQQNESSVEKPPTEVWQFDLIMEKLRQKSSKLNSLDQISKNIKNSLNERRCILDQNDKIHLQKCLDTLQQSIRVNSLQSLVERLESISRQIGLKLTPGSEGNDWFISSEMFYLELIIDPKGIVQEVNIHHEGKSDPQSCPEMIECLRNHDFVDFAAHLEGLVSIYQLPNTDMKIKSKAFVALSSLEVDLGAMANTYPKYNDGESIVMKSLLGLVIPRKGGHSVKLVYFISPYDFLDATTKTTLPNDYQTIVSKKLGTFGSIQIQGASLNKLQMSTTVSIQKTSDGKTIPRFGTLNATNSTVLPAVFTINLGKSVPFCKELLNVLEGSIGIKCYDESILTACQPILNLITHHISNGQIIPSNNKGLYVSLPDQAHCYYISESESNISTGVLVPSISFTLPSQLPQIVGILRQQLLFNTLVSSCIRPGTKSDPNAYAFEINATSYKNLTVSFEHPFDDCIVNLEIDLKDIIHPHCKLIAPSSAFSNGINTNSSDILPTLEELASRIIQRSLSIPVTMRAILARWQTLKPKVELPNPDFNIPVGESNLPSNQNYQIQPMEVSCGTESNQGTQQSNNAYIPGMVLNPPLVHTSNFSQHSNINENKSNNLAGGRKTSISNTSFTISPITSTASQQQQQQNQLLSYMNTMNNPLFQNNYSLQMNMNMNIIASQITSQQQQAVALAQQQQQSKILDDAGQRGKRRKRKGTSNDGQQQQQQQQQHQPANLPRPSPSPSPKSPKSVGRSSNQKRRPSEGSDYSDHSNLSDRNTPTPQTPLGIFMSEFGLDGPGGNWNIDITPVGTSSTTMSSSTATPTTTNTSNDLMYNSKALSSNFGGHIQQQLKQPHEIKEEPLESPELLRDRSFNKKSSSLLQFNKQNIKREIPVVGGGFPPKRSISLDSSDPNSSSPSNIQSILSAAHSGMNLSEGSVSLSGNDFKPLVTASLSITPVSGQGGTSNMYGNSSVSSILAFNRPGIEIIPLNNSAVHIPNSITVTPITSQASSAASSQATASNTAAAGVNKDKTKESIEKVIKSELKKERKRKALSEDLTDSGAEFSIVPSSKQPKLLGPFTSTASTLEKTISSTSKNTLANPNVKSFSNNKKPTSTSASPNLQQGLSNRSPSSSHQNKSSTSPSSSKQTNLKSNSPNNQQQMQGNNQKPKSLQLFKEKKSNNSNNNSNTGGSNSGANKMTKNLSAAALALAASQMPNLKAIGGSSGDNISNIPNLLALSSGSGNKSTTAGSAAAAQDLSSVAAQMAQAQRKKGLLAVIDKLNKQHSVDSPSGGGGQQSNTPPTATDLKDMGKIDYLKASSNITSDVQSLQQQHQQQKKPITSGQQGNLNIVNNPEYMVKQQGQSSGLKMTINKSKLGSGIITKRTGLKTIAKKSPSQQQQQGQGGLKLPGSPNRGVGSPSGKKSIGSSSSNKDGKSLIRGNSPKPRVDAEDLTKKLFMPGSVKSLEGGIFSDAPKFNPNSFQIPKKSRAGAAGPSGFSKSIQRDGFSEMPKLEISGNLPRSTSYEEKKSSSENLSTSNLTSFESSPISSIPMNLSTSTSTSSVTPVPLPEKDKGLDEKSSINESQNTVSSSSSGRVPTPTDLSDYPPDAPESPDSYSSFQQQQKKPLKIPTSPQQLSSQSATPSPTSEGGFISYSEEQPKPQEDIVEGTQKDSLVEQGKQVKDENETTRSDNSFKQQQQDIFTSDNININTEERSKSIDSSTPSPPSQPNVQSNNEQTRSKKNEVIIEDDDEKRLVIDLPDEKDKNSSSKNSITKKQQMKNEEEAAASSGNGNPTMLPPPPPSPGPSPLAVPSPKPFPAVPSPVPVPSPSTIINSPRPTSSPRPCRLEAESPSPHNSSPYTIEDDLMNDAVTSFKS